MAGLLDFNNPEMRMGLGLLALGQMPKAQGFQGLMGLLASQDDAARMKAETTWRQEQANRQRQEWEMKDAAAKAQAAQRAAIPSLFTPGEGGGVSGFDVQRALQLGVDPDEIPKLAALSNVGRAKVARTVEGVDEAGRPVTYQVDEFGQRVGDGIGQWKAPMAVNQGDRTTFVDPATMQQRGSLNINMSQAERDASARGWAGQALARERFNVEQTQGAKPTFNAEAGGFIYPPSASNPQGGIVPLPGFQKPLNDVQAKAQLFGTRMMEADKILSDLGKNGKVYSTPGANAPVIGGVINAMNTEQGQMLDQAKRDFVNAVLRRESGAAIGKSEFESAEKQYFPQIGESDKVIAQKARARKIAIQGILAEVPKGAPSINVDGKAPNTGGASGGWGNDASNKPAKTVVKTGMYGGRKVVQYSDGTVDYAN
jgi:hypothetical protein